MVDTPSSRYDLINRLRPCSYLNERHPVAIHVAVRKRSPLARVTFLANINDREIVSLFAGVLQNVGSPALPSVANLNPAEVGKLAPDLLICDVDELEVDPLEMLRQVRFVLPACIVVVYTGDAHRAWGAACHLAGANGVLSKASNGAQIEVGIRAAIRDGCFTDPRIAA